MGSVTVSKEACKSSELLWKVRDASVSAAASPQLQNESIAFVPLVFQPFLKLLMYGNAASDELLYRGGNSAF